jgi:hypothetical protein
MTELEKQICGQMTGVEVMLQRCLAHIAYGTSDFEAWFKNEHTAALRDLSVLEIQAEGIVSEDAQAIPPEKLSGFSQTAWRE